MSDVSVRKISSKADLKKFIHVTRDIYADDPAFIQSLTLERMDVLSRDKNPYYEHAEVALLLAERGGKPVGRMSVQIDELAQEKWGPNLAHFGFFEAMDADTAKALTAYGEEWAKKRGCTRLQGPWSFSANEECGMLIDGFDTPPFIMMPHGKPDYKVWMEELGFEKAKDMFAFFQSVPSEPTKRSGKIYNIAKRNKALTFRQIDMKRFDEELKLILDIFNDAWSDNWGYVPMTPAEVEHAAKNLKPVIKAYRTFICEYEGEAAAFMVTIPDVNHFIRDLNGSLFPFGIFKLVWRMLFAKEERVRVPLMGVRKKFHSKPIGGMMPIAMIEATREQVSPRGTRFSETSWILEDNTNMINIIEEMGGRRYKTMRIWEKAL